MNESFPQHPSPKEQINPEDDNFVRQFSHPEEIPFGTTQFESWDIQPFEQTKDTPILFVPGWGKTPRSYEDGLKEYSKAGRRVLTLSFPTEDLEMNEENENRFPVAQANRARAILALLEAKGIEKVDVVGHSEGCMNAAIAAEATPEFFRHFVFIAPPGLTGKESHLGIIKAGAKNASTSKAERKTATPEEEERYMQGENDIKEWLRKRGKIKGILESMNPGRIEIDDLIRDLKTQGHGISIVAGADDHMVSMEKFQTKNAEELGVDGFYSVAGGHERIAIKPEQYACLAEKALESLEKKYETKEQLAE